MSKIDPDFEKDLVSEKEFLKSMTTALGAGKLKFDKGASAMVKVYNEQLEHLIRLRFDLEVFNYLILAEPTEKTHTDNKRKTEQALAGKRMTLMIIRRQITEALEKQNGK